MDQNTNQTSSQPLSTTQNPSPIDQTTVQTPIPEQKQDTTTPTQVINEDQDMSETYITNTGGAMINLLKEVAADPKVSQYIAKEMSMQPEQFTQTLSQLLQKIDQGQLTAVELAVIMTAPAADEMPAE